MTLFRPKEVRLDSRLLVSRGKTLQKWLSFLFILVIILVLAKFAIFKPTITGLITVREEANYTDIIGLVVDASRDYYWFLGNPGDLRSIRLDGAITTNGSAKVYIEHKNITYLIFDSAQLGGGLDVITGAVILDETVIEGIRTNIPLHQDILRGNTFQKGMVNIHYLEKWMNM